MNVDFETRKSLAADFVYASSRVLHNELLYLSRELTRKLQNQDDFIEMISGELTNKMEAFSFIKTVSSILNHAENEDDIREKISALPCTNSATQTLRTTTMSILF